MDKQYYDNFFTKHGERAHLDPERFEQIAKLCHGFVIDFACGTGHLADFYKGDYTGLDISSVAIKHAQKNRRKGANFVIADCTKDLPASFGSADTVVMAEFLEHITDDSVVFKNVLKLLKPNGRILISVPNAGAIPDEDHHRIFTIPSLRKKLSKYGRVRFYNWPGVRERIIVTVDLSEKNEKQLSVCMFAKDEAEGIESALLSTIEFADEIVVIVDDKSTDRTLEIATHYADIHKSFVWENSFCKARNMVQKLATSKWILALDGHEFVAKDGNIKKYLNDKYDSYQVKIMLENDFDFWFPRIVRRDIVWDQDVHNRPNCKKTARLLSFFIQHDRDNSQSKASIEARNVQRDKMVHDILSKQLRENPKDARAMFYLAQQAHHSKNFSKALKYFKKYLKFSRDKEERWLVRHYISIIHIEKKHYFRCLLSCWKTEKEVPERWENQKMLGILYMIINKHDVAVQHLIASLKPNEKIHAYNPERHDLAQAWDFIGICFQRLKKMDEARKAWARAIELEKKVDGKKRVNERLEILKRMLNK